MEMCLTDLSVVNAAKEVMFSPSEADSDAIVDLGRTLVKEEWLRLRGRAGLGSGSRIWFHLVKWKLRQSTKKQFLRPPHGVKHETLIVVDEILMNMNTVF